MKTSESITKLAPALLKAQKAITFAVKDATNPHFKSKYADFHAVIDAVKEPLNNADIFFSQTPSPSEDGRLHLTTRLLHTSGEWMEDTAVCPLPKADPQGFGSALTYLKRYSLAAFVGLPTLDDDGEGSLPQPRVESSRNAVSAPAKAIPAPVQVPRDPNLDPAGAGWRQVVVPKFIKKYAGQTLGEMPDNDLLWWAGNYQPKPFKGSITQADTDFRKALDAAQAELTADVSYDQTKTDDSNPF